MDVTKKLLSLQEVSKAQLAKLLSANPSIKYLVLDPNIIRPLEKVCTVNWLKGNGIEKIFKLNGPTPTSSTQSIFYLIYANNVTFAKVVDQIRSQVDIENPVKNKFHVICVPTILYNFEIQLEELCLLDSTVTLHSFQWMPLYLDTNIMSLEVPDLYNSLFVRQVSYFVPTLSKTLWKLFFVVGAPRFIVSLGVQANAVLKQYEMICDDKGDSDKLDSDFGSLLIIDRNVDYVSALLSPVTYSALLTEIYNVNAGICETLETETENYDSKCNPISPKKPLQFKMDSTHDNVYADIKNRYFTEVTALLSELTKQLKSEKISSESMALDEIKRYVQTQLQHTKNKKTNVTNHLNAAETIINVLGHRYENQREVEACILKNTGKSKNVGYLEELLVTSNDPYIALRLFCLISITQTLTESEIKSIWRKYLQHFGYQYGYTFHNLVSCGFLPEASQTTTKLSSKIKIPKFTSSSFYSNAKSMRQIINEPEKINLKYPTCPSYVYGGLYIPLMVQIASLILSAAPIEEMRLKFESFAPLLIRNNKGYPLESRSVLIYVIGGVTYAEIAACNLLETITGAKICLLSDKIISGNDLMKGLLQVPE